MCRAHTHVEGEMGVLHPSIIMLCMACSVRIAAAHEPESLYIAGGGWIGSCRSLSIAASPSSELTYSPQCEWVPHAFFTN